MSWLFLLFYNDDSISLICRNESEPEFDLLNQYVIILIYHFRVEVGNHGSGFGYYNSDSVSRPHFSSVTYNIDLTSHCFDSKSQDLVPHN